MAKACDGWADCQNGEDEDQCSRSHEHWTLNNPPPGFVQLSKDGFLEVRSFAQLHDSCPHTHFRCPGNGYCLPMILRCNGIYDCSGREDEAKCESCPGFYRCRASSVCLHHSNLCDSHAHCPQHDDERVCGLVCPLGCTCQGMAFFCSRNFAASDYPLLRFLDASNSSIIPAHLNGNMLLVFLSLGNCSLTLLEQLVLPNLLSLNLENNRLSTITHDHLEGIPQLRELSVAGNPLVSVFGGVRESRSFHHLLKLDMSFVVMHVLNVSLLSSFPSLQFLNLSHSKLQHVLDYGMSLNDQLSVLDLRGCPMIRFPHGMFARLKHLKTIYAQNFRICCPEVLPPEFNLHKCFAPLNEISSCDDLLRGKVYSVCVFVLSLSALVGNAVSFTFRTCIAKRENKLGYANFVTHLSVSDFLMGIYLAIIGVADQVFHGTYLWNDETWRHSATCKLAGFLSLLSSEVSALIMCLITLDRFLVLCFPFRRLHFTLSSAHMAAVASWVVGLLLVSVPLLPVTLHWDFYSQTGICIPLPTSSREFHGYFYSFCVLIVFNFAVFVFISMGQLSIYWSVRANAMSVSNTSKKTKDLTIARRLFTVAMSDFLCWFPIGVLGLVASKGTPIPGEVNVIMAIFVLPLNSAVNPSLYTFNIISERRRRSREGKLRALLLAQSKQRS